MTARRVADRALTVAAALGVLCLVLVVVGPMVGVRPVFFRSGSMAPAISTGSLALVQRVPAADVRLGDVVAVHTSTGSRVAHRVVGRRGAALVLKGDANRAPDPEPYAVATADRVLWDVPTLGYAAGWIASPAGVLTCVALGAAFVVLLVVQSTVQALRRARAARPRRPRPQPGRRRRVRDRRRLRRGAVGGLLLLVVLVLLVGPGQVRPGWAAAWTDPVTTSGSTYDAATVPAPATFTCGTLGVLSVTFNWTAVAGATGYTLHYGAGGSLTTSVAGTSATVVAVITNGTAWVEANRSFGSVTWTSTASTSRTYTVAAVSLCS